MTLDELLVVLERKDLRFRSRDGEVVVAGEPDAVDAGLLEELRTHKQDLLRLAGAEGEWWTPPAVITPDMLPLVDLTADEIERIASAVPGGAANVQDIYPLAPLQDGILFHHLWGGDGDPYLLSVEYSFDSYQRLERYLDALRAVVDRHDILRTAIVWEGVREPVQVVLRQVDLPVEHVEFSGGALDAAAELYARFDPRRYRMDVRHAPMLRIYVARDQAHDRWLMMMLRHHLTGDHTTSAAMRDELEALLRGDGANLPEPVPFRNLVAQARLGVSAAEHEAYFRALLGDVDEPTVPFGLSNVYGDGTGIRQFRMTADPALARRTREQSRRLGVSMASLCHVAWGQVLARVSNREEVIFGTVLLGRMQGGDGADRAFGVFMNTLPVRIGVGQASPETTVRQMQIQLADLLRHEHASLALAQRCSGVRAPAPLFTSLLNYRHSADPHRVWSEAETRAREGMSLLRREAHTSYPLMMSVDEMGDRLAFTADVHGDVDPRRVCAYMHQALDSLVTALAGGSVSALRHLEVLPETERREVLHAWNGARRDDAEDSPVHELFEARVSRTPDAPAVEFDDVVVTYAQLNARANRLAHYLRGQGVGPDHRVALCVGRNIEMIVAVLAVVKAGGAYVPLDPAYPEARLRFMLADSAPAALIVDGTTRSILATDGAQPIIDLGTDDGPWCEHPETNPPRGALHLDHLVYVIYTSGSTGLPKGVMMPHRAMANLLAWQFERFGTDAAVRTLQFTATGFDVAFQEIFSTLCSGGTLVLLDQETKWDAARLFQYVQNRRVQRMFTPLIGLHLLADGMLACRARDQPVGCSLREIVTAGDRLRIEPTISTLFRSLPGCVLDNQYGPTETHVVSAYRLDPDVDPASWPILPPIGPPLPNTRIYILDETGRPAPCGVAGELYLAGAQVARGYWHRPELTGERFVADPFAGGGARMYRTGDTGRWRPDGSIEFLGRNDFQIKIRGFRIEVGEIEAQLSACDGVAEALVVARDDASGSPRLVAYYTSATAAGTGADALRARLSLVLPDYMVPSAYVRLESLPLTPTGKLDRKALPEPGSDAYAVRTYEAPIGEVEAAIAGIWTDVLKVDRVGRRDNFFALGGHSLLAITVVERLRRAGFGVDVRALFATPELADLAATARSRERVVDVPENRIPPECQAITPDMVSLIDLTQAEIDEIVAAVPGGAANVQDIYPLAPLQEGMLFHHLISGDHDPYLLPVQFSFDTRESIDPYLDALRALIDRHEILRTAIVWERLREPVQVVHRRVQLPVVEVHLDPDAGDAAEQLYARFDPRRYRLDVRRAPMLHVYIARDPVTGRWLMLVLRHHLTGDHTAFDLMRDEIEAHVAGRGASLPQPVPFRNLVAQARLGVGVQEHEAYFCRLLGDVEETTAPFGQINVHGDGTATRQVRRTIDVDLARRTREQARTLGVSTASLCHVAWAQVLARVSGRHDVAFGTVLFGRMQGGEGADRGLGIFMNTLPVRIRLDQDNAETSVRRTQIQLADLLRHEHASLALAQRCSRVRAPAPLFTSLLNYRHSVDPDRIPPDSQPRTRQGARLLRREARTNYPLVMSVDDFGTRLSLTADVQGDVDGARICGYMHQALDSLVAALERVSDTPVQRLPVLPAAERAQVLHEWNATAVAYPLEQCVHELFEAQVRRTPGAAAVVQQNAVVTYEALNGRANRLASALRASGVRPDQRVAVCMERSVEMVVALLGVLKAGGAYVPLEPSYPVERLRFMVGDSAPVAILTQRHLRGLVDTVADAVPVLEVDDGVPFSDPVPANPPRGGLTPQHLAYVIYTSGSTGTPKGVMVGHRGVVNRLLWMQDACGLGPDDAVLQKTPFTFDVSVWELFWPLAYGARLVIAEPEGHKDPLYLSATIRRHRITTIHFVPSMLQAFLSGGHAADSTSLSRVVCSGEALPAGLARQCRQLVPSAELHNLYGPTEASVEVTAWTIPPGFSGSTVPIGRPIANTAIYILDEHGEPAPLGVAGELCIGGVQVARGYLNRPALTAERFVPNPFVTEAGARMYRTGDQARWLPDGTIEFLGRNDFQLKIRGSRIELGEIEARLRECAGVEDVVVVARNDRSGDTQLVAYYTNGAAERIAAETFRAHVSATLPDYMVPAGYVRMASFPLTANGKLDRNALPVPGEAAYAVREYEAPIGDIEVAVAAIWVEVLGVDRVSRRDHFFDLGGHSLLAVQVMARLRDALGVEVGLKDLFTHPVLADCARALATATRAHLPPLGAADRSARLPVSFAQRRLWFLAQMDGASEAYHLPFGVRLNGALNHAALKRALDAIVERHEVLRTRFVFRDGEPEQRLVPAAEARFALKEHDLRMDPDAAGSLRRLAAEEASERFDLAHGPLIRGRLIRTGDEAHVLLITMHHIASDGWSMGVLRRDLGALYGAYARGEGDPLPPLAVQYADYAVWQRTWMTGDVWQEQSRYWSTTLQGTPSLLPVPTDHPRPVEQVYSGGSVPVMLDEALTAELRALSRRHSTTLYMTLLASWAALLARLSGEPDLVIGTPVANRSCVDLEPLIGFFVNTLAIRIDMSGSPAVGTLLAQVKAQTLAAQQHQDLPFEQVVELLNPARSLSHSPLFQVMFAWQAPREDTQPLLPGLEARPLGVRRSVHAQFDLTLSLHDGDRIEGALMYATSLFERATIERYLGYFVRLLRAMVTEADTVDRLPMLPEPERTQLVVAWNATAVPYPRDSCIHELIESQAARTPAATAVEHDGAGLSYAEFNARANRLAYQLRAQRVGPDRRVAVCLDRGLDLMVALLAVLKAGGAYVALDPSHPDERLRFIVEHSAPVVLLASDQSAARARALAPRVPIIDVRTADGRGEPETNPDREGLTAGHVAYVMYTSGSTGMPKGVTVEHRSVVNFFTAMDALVPCQPPGIWLAVTTASFDISVLEMFWTLARGFKVVLRGEQVERLLEQIADGGITHMQCTPSMARLLIPEGHVRPGRKLEVLAVGGEALSPALAQQLRASIANTVINMYGPTETTIWSSSCRIREGEDRVTIGAPLANTRIYVLDRHLEPVPVGVTGEIHIGGAGVARGYENRPASTAERFIPDPFAAEAGARMYRTGDLGRWLPQGTIEFLGRTDFQVKIRGFRIEPGEIEARLRACEGVSDAVVVLREDLPGDTRLVAYYTTAGEPGDAERFRAELSAALPAYMVPSAYVRLASLPLTPNRKLDRKALPEPEADDHAIRAYDPPVGDVETAIAGIWADLLHVDRIGRRDNFFALGGHSLLAVALVERLRRQELQLDVRALFATPQLADLAASVRRGAVAEIPESGVPEGSTVITPDMLPLIDLTPQEIEQIVRAAPGGAPNVKDIYPLTPLQEGMLFHHLLGGEGDPYLSSTQLRFDNRGQLDRALDAMRWVISRHDILRTAVMWEGLEQPVQVVLRRVDLAVDELTLNPQDGPTAEQLYVRLEPRRRHLDVRQAPLLRVCVAHDAHHDQWLMLVLRHHLTGDRVTGALMQREIDAYLRGTAGTLPDPLPFRTLVAQSRHGANVDDHETYFRGLLGDVDEPTAPFGLMDVRGDGTGVQQARLVVDEELARRTREEARALGVSAAMLCHVAWAQVLARVTGRDDVVFGTVLLGRMHDPDSIGRVLGVFINTLPVRIDVAHGAARDVVRRTHQQLAELLRHEQASLALAQRCSRVPPPAPLFSSLLNYRHGADVTRTDAVRRAWQDVDAHRLDARTNYPLVLSVDDWNDGFGLTAQVNGAVDPARICGYMHRALESLVEALSAGAAAMVRELEVLPAPERQQLLSEWNATESAYPEGQCIHELFEAQVRQRPDATAVRYEEARLSYRELNARANQLAQYLRARGVTADDRVGLCLEPGFEMVVALFAVLKAGGAYVPLDPAYPHERLRFMVDDSAPVAVLTRGPLAGFAGGIANGVPVIDLDGEAPWHAYPAGDSLGRHVTPDHLAYVIYTSGSTGTPKGVMTHHRSIVNRLWHGQRYWPLEPGERILAHTSLGFDNSARELLWPLIVGAEVVLIGKDATRDPSRLIALIRREGISTLNLVPSLLKMLLDDPDVGACTSVVRVLCSGEALPAALGARCRDRLTHAALHNVYGPSEAATAAVALNCTDDVSAAAPPIGRPFANTRIYILDRHRAPVPVGVTGELHLAGAGVARGYLNRPGLTAERFVPDPFAGDRGARMYRTGDLGRWRRDGTIELVGRNDFQVKIRGFRIELGEIEAKLRDCCAVDDAVVMAREDPPVETRLVAYYTSRAGESDDGERFRTQLAAALPPYMVPSAYVRLAAFPLTPSGKLDRLALPAPEAGAYARREYEAPLGDVETAIAMTWAEMLRVDRVGRRDNFFALGGHSLLAVSLVERLRRKGLQLDVRALFATPELADLAASIRIPEGAIAIPENRIPLGSDAITPDMLPLVDLTQQEVDRIVAAVPGGAANIQDIYPLAPLQEGILFHHLLGGDGDPYVLSMQLSFDTRERVDRYLDAVRVVIARHDILRSAVMWDGLSQPVQVVLRRADLPVEELSLGSEGTADGSRPHARLDPARHRMDVRRAPLLRIYVARDRDRDRWLMLVLRHHLTGDHTTSEVVQQELAVCLRGEGAMLPAPLQFRTLVAHARRQGAADDHEAYFRALLGDVDTPTAPFGLLDVRGDGTAVRQARLAVEPEVAQRLREEARKLGVSPAILCHVAWARLLARVSGRDDVVFGTVLFGRMHGAERIDRALGVFMNTLPVRIDAGRDDVRTTVRTTQRQLAELLRHEQASLALAQRCSRVAAPAPLFTALLNYRHTPAAGTSVALEAREWEGIQILGGHERTNYPLILSIDDRADGFGLKVQVDGPVDPARVCGYMHQTLASLVEALASESPRQLGELEVLPAAERQQVIHEWNATAKTSLYVLDQSGAPAPVGVTGALYVGGVRAPRGLTAERVVRNPFVDDPDAQMYRTGDLARWLPDGTIEVVDGRSASPPAPATDGRPDAAAHGYEAPIGEIETAVAEIWADVLRVERVGRLDDFFALGGLSLSAVQVMVRLRQAVGVEAPLKDLFAHPVLADFARGLERAVRTDLPPLARADRGARLPLSFAQQRLWFLAQMDGGGEAYHVPFSVRLTGALDRAALQAALDRIVARHEALRTRFVAVDGEPEQRIAPASESRFLLVAHDLRGARDPSAELRRIVAEEARAPFDLAQGPLIRGRIIRTGDAEHALLITMHHIAADGWSMGVLRRELRALYAAYAAGESDPLPPLLVQYADYAAWQRTWMAGPAAHRLAAFWTTTLRGAPALCPLPTDHPRPAEPAYAGGRIPLALDAELSTALRALSKRHGTTLYMTLLGAWAALLSRLSGESDVVIGTPVANRSRVDVEPLIGFFVNTLAIRIDVSGSPTVAELLARTKAQTLAAQQHQDLPFEGVVEAVNPVRSLAHSPVFQVMFAWQAGGETRLTLPGLEVAPLELSSPMSAKFDLTLSLSEIGGRIVGGLTYAAALFEPATIERYKGAYIRLLTAMVDEATTVDRLPLLEAEERRQVVYGWNQTSVPSPSDRCVHELFDAQVRQTPAAIAIVCDGVHLTYQELQARANRLAHYLRAQGAGPDRRVAICVPRGIDQIVAVLAVWKAGAAYVPLDAAYPDERLQFMIADSAPAVLLTHEWRPASGASDTCPVVALEDPRAPWLQYPAASPDRDGLTDRHLAYVLHTSGSTGTPKGVAVEHRSVCNMIAAQAESCAIDASSQVLQFASFSFDVSVAEIGMALCQGATLHLITRTEALLGPGLVQTLAHEGITHLALTPSVLATVPSPEGLPNLRVLIVGGEPLTADAVKMWAPGRRVVHQYGPTEATVMAAWHACDAAAVADPPIGRPAFNTRLYILDANGEPVPVGVTGELHIGGAGVARGYWNQPGFTAERFIPERFATDAGARMYRTGDLARWRPDGTIDFVGRNDQQVKIRGLRVELGEVEARLRACAGVAEAVVMAREDIPGEKRLVAYYSSPATEALSPETFRTQLSAALPQYMLPSAYVRVDTWPRTPTGKLDRLALPAPGTAGADAASDYQAPLGDIETAISDVWANVLKVRPVGRHDSFFNLGGHSLLAVKAVHLLQRAGIEVSVLDVFIQPTPAGLAETIASGTARALPVRPVCIRRGASPHPLFFVHDGFGKLTYATMIAHGVEETLPIYGLLGPAEVDAPLTTVDAMVTRLIHLIRAQQPSGPYSVAGWSFGGVLAYEVAARLLQEGERVAFLGMFDSGATSVRDDDESEPRLDDKYLLAHWMEGRAGTDEQRQALAELRREAASLAYDEMVRRGRALSLMGRMHDLTPPQIRRELIQIVTLGIAMHHHRPKPISIPVHLFVTEDNTPATLGWTGILTDDQLRVWRVPGNHLTMMDHPHAGDVGRTLTAAMRSTELAAT